MFQVSGVKTQTLNPFIIAAITSLCIIFLFNLSPAFSQEIPQKMPTEKTYTNSIGMKFVRIKPGTFTMGRSSAERKGYLSVCQGRNGLIHLISSWNHYAFNLKWLETPPPTG